MAWGKSTSVERGARHAVSMVVLSCLAFVHNRFVIPRKEHGVRPHRLIRGVGHTVLRAVVSCPTLIHVSYRNPERAGSIRVGVIDAKSDFGVFERNPHIERLV